MKLFVLFNPNWFEWPLAIGEEMARRHGGCRLRGIVTGERRVYETVVGRNGSGVSDVDWLEHLERRWLDTALDERRIRRREAEYDAQTLRRIIIADRQIGHGFVSGGKTPRTALVRRTQDFDQVRRYVVGLLEHLTNEFEKHRPDLVLTHVIASGPAYALGCVAERFGIPFAQLGDTRIGSHVVIQDRREPTLSAVQDVFGKTSADPAIVAEKYEIAKSYLEEFRASQLAPVYAERAAASAKQSLSVNFLLRQTAADIVGSMRDLARRKPTELRKLSRPQLGVHRASKWFSARNALRNGIFDDVADIPDEKFAYFPLHVDPEASTMVLSPDNTDQIATIRAIAKHLPLDFNLVVKEHFPMLGLRPAGFYAAIKRIPGVYLVSPFEDNMRLLKSCALTCTITGTVGWEALLLGKPLVLIGEPHYAALEEGLVRCPDLRLLSEAIQRAIKTPPADDKRLILFIASLLKDSIEFPGALIWDRQTPELVRQNWDVVRQLCDRLDRIATTPLTGDAADANSTSTASLGA